MSDIKTRVCPECAESSPFPIGFDRRDFIRAVSGVVGAMAGTSLLGARAFADNASPGKPAESLVRELYSGLSVEQKHAVCLPWNHGVDKGLATRLKTYNSVPLGKKLGEAFSKPQQELIRETLKAVLSGEEAYDRLKRGGTWDGAGSFEGNGVAIFGDPSGKEPFSWVFAGHHLTLRCDGNSEPNAGFGGPMYYGHSANGHSDTNVYNYQTKQVMSVFDMLNEKQRGKAVVVGNPGDGVGAVKFRPKAEARPGVAYADLDASQQELVTGVMRTLLGPFRKEDGDEVMQLIKTNGGMEKVNLAFYKDDAEKGNDRWDYWRLEGPGFVWNYRVLPHVHCYVNVAVQA